MQLQAVKVREGNVNISNKKPEKGGRCLISYPAAGGGVHETSCDVTHPEVDSAVMLPTVCVCVGVV